MDNIKLQRLADIIARSERIVFFGGAGVSTESGLRDYRSEDGIYTAISQYGYPPEEILSHDFFFDKTKAFYEFYRDFFMGDPNPNGAHIALAQLEKMGKLTAVITQNIDNLHQKAGSKTVLELHGTTEKYTCPKCRAKYTKEYLAKTEGVPRCEKCGAAIKPDVVLYGEMLDDDTVSKALEAISNADTLIIGGTSLAVYPAAGFIRYFKGKNLIVINKGDTSMDSRADLLIRDSIGQALTEVLNILYARGVFNYC